MNKRAWIVAMVAVLCSMSPGRGEMLIEGPVFPGVEMGCWILEDVHTGWTFNIFGGPERSVWLLAWGRPRPDLISFCMQGQIFEVIHYWVDGLAEKVSSDPGCDGTLCKMADNALCITFSAPITLGDGPALQIARVGGSPDVSASFVCCVEPDGLTLKATEAGSVLNDRNWYRVTPGSGLDVVPFTFDVCVLCGDADGNGRVTTADYSCVKAAMGQRADVRADLNGSGRVTTADYSVVKHHMGCVAPELFDYGASPRPDEEAEILAIEYGSSLLADDAMYERIHRDLAAIRAYQPEVAEVVHHPAWAPDELLAKVFSGVPTSEFEALNAYYQTTIGGTISRPDGTTYLLSFPGRLWIPWVADEYEALAEVDYAEPNHRYGEADAIYIQTGSGVWEYHFVHGWGDCMAGCIWHACWTFEVDASGYVEQTDTLCGW